MKKTFKNFNGLSILELKNIRGGGKPIDIIGTRHGDGSGVFTGGGEEEDGSLWDDFVEWWPGW